MATSSHSATTPHATAAGCHDGGERDEHVGHAEVHVGVGDERADVAER